MRRRIAALTLLAVLAGCDSQAPTRPDDAPTPPGPGPESPPQATAITIAGDGRFAALNQVHPFTATAQMSNGSARDVTAEASWSSSNSRVATVSARGEVTSVGVGLATISAEFTKVSSVDVVVAPEDRSQIPGLYRLSFTAASACTLPDWARHREYDATLDQPSPPNDSGAPLVLTVQLHGGFAPRFPGHIKGSRVGFWLPTDDYYGGGDPIFADRIDGGRLFTVNGEAEGKKGATRDIQITGSLHGPIRAVNPATGATIAACNVSGNQFSLVRQ